MFSSRSLQIAESAAAVPSRVIKSLLSLRGTLDLHALSVSYALFIIGVSIRKETTVVVLAKRCNSAGSGAPS